MSPYFGESICGSLLLECKERKVKPVNTVLFSVYEFEYNHSCFLHFFFLSELLAVKCYGNIINVFLLLRSFEVDSV